MAPAAGWARQRRTGRAIATLSSPKLSGDNRAAAAEFNLAPLLADLRLNRPLRLQLSGVFVELPVPPYVVGIWRELAEADTPPAPLER